MKISLNWLQDFIKITTEDLQLIKEKITERTAEVETIDSLGGGLEKMVVGKILEIKPHPNADKLKLVQTDIGNEVIQIVCGGSNLKTNMLVAVAQPGSFVRWHGEGDLIPITKTKIRGEESMGMICVSNEIGLDSLFPSTDEQQIIDLSNLKLTIGSDLSKALNLDDIIFNIDNHAITHRPDLFSQLGFAREFVANDLGFFHPQQQKIGAKINIPENDLPLDIQFTDPNLCSRYVATTLDHITIQESPQYLQQRLIACGIRPINNIVDISNYVMLEYGIPCHAFDLDKIQGKKVVHRKSKVNEELTTLDGIKRQLPAEAIIIEDEKGIIDLCGIMGGESSQITPQTKRIWIHFANFNKTLIRRAIIALGHRTEAATILEKGVPPFFAYEAMLRALELITASCPATKLSSKILDIKNYHEEKRIIDLHHDSIKRIAGIDCSPEETKSILEKLGFKIETDLPGHFGVEIPGFRFSDINIEADLIEEVARIYGYNKIEAIIPKAPVKVANLPLDKKLAKIIQNFLVATGMFEVYTFSFLGKELIKKMEESIDQSYIHIANYISEDMSLLRQSLLPRLLEIIEKNLRYQNEVNVFELGKVFYKIEEKIQESRLLTGLFCGENSSFRQAKGCVETLLTKLNLEPSFAYIEKNLFPFVHPGNNAEIFVHNKSIGLITDLHPLIKKNFGIEKPVSLFEIDFEMLVNIGLKLPIYTPLPKYPTITLDISILIPKRDLAQKYLDIIKNTNKLLIKNIKIIDEYIGNQIPANQRSLTFSIVFAAEERTLKEEEAFTIQQMIIQELKKAGAELRA